MAVSVKLLSFFCAIFERLCDATHALAAALSTYYARRGFRVMDHKVSDILHLLSSLTIKCIRAGL